MISILLDRHTTCVHLESSNTASMLHDSKSAFSADGTVTNEREVFGGTGSTVEVYSPT